MCIHCGFSLVSLRLQPCLLDQCQVALHLSYLAQEGVVCMTTSSVNPGTFFRFIVVGSSTPGQMPGQVPNAMRQMPLMPLGNMYGICSHRLQSWSDFLQQCSIPAPAPAVPPRVMGMVSDTEVHVVHVRYGGSKARNLGFYPARKQ